MYRLTSPSFVPFYPTVSSRQRGHDWFSRKLETHWNEKRTMLLEENIEIPLDFASMRWKQIESHRKKKKDDERPVALERRAEEEKERSLRHRNVLRRPQGSDHLKAVKNSNLRRFFFVLSLSKWCRKKLIAFFVLDRFRHLEQRQQRANRNHLLRLDEISLSPYNIGEGTHETKKREREKSYDRREKGEVEKRRRQEGETDLYMIVCIA